MCVVSDLIVLEFLRTDVPITVLLFGTSGNLLVNRADQCQFIDGLVRFQPTV